MNYKCPICDKELHKTNKTYKCVNNHSFDIAKEDYVNLLISNKSSHGDNNFLMKSRIDFLNKGYYSALKDKLIETINMRKHGVLIDLACGEGYYTRYFSEISTVYGFDLSKTGIKYAAKQDPQSRYCLANIFRIPLFDHQADIVTTIFAPISVAEISRLLKKDGYFIEVIPNENHLIEYKEVLYEKIILNVIDNKDKGNLKLVESINVDDNIHLDNNNDIMNLFNMTPYTYKTSLDAIEKLKTIDNMDVSLHFIINVYQNTID
jgi:23S rRNA (guanine745-N1)-methyltransferase